MLDFSIVYIPTELNSLARSMDRSQISVILLFGTKFLMSFLVLIGWRYKVDSYCAPVISKFTGFYILNNVANWDIVC